MAVYRGPERRRRASAAIAVAALLAGVLLGAVIGRGTATSVDDQIAEGRAAGRDLVTSLRVLPLEYRQASAGSSETGLIEDTVKRATGRLPAALDKAPWLDRSPAPDRDRGGPGDRGGGSRQGPAGPVRGDHGALDGDAADDLRSVRALT